MSKLYVCGFLSVAFLLSVPINGMEKGKGSAADLCHTEGLDMLLVPYSKAKLLKLAHEEPGLFWNLVNINKIPESEFYKRILRYSVKLLAQHGFLRAWALGPEGYEKATMASCFEKVLPDVLMTLRKELDAAAASSTPLSLDQLPQRAGADDGAKK